MDTIALIKEIFLLITAFAGLVGTGIGTYFAVKGAISSAKNKTIQENWNTLMAIADAAMQKAEHSDSSNKKDMVIGIVKEGAKAAGINIDDFLDKLSAYIDQSISFFNGMKGKK